MWFPLYQRDKIIRIQNLSGSSNKTRASTSAVCVFLLGYFIWFAEEAVPAGEASRQEDRHEGGGDVSHPGGGKALRVLWALLSAAHSREKFPCQGDILQPAEPQGCGQLCLCHRGLFSLWFWGGFHLGEATGMSCCVVFWDLCRKREDQLGWWVPARIKWDFNWFWLVCCLFQAVKVALDVHLNEPEGDILVFLTGENFPGYSQWIMALPAKQKSFQSLPGFSQSSEKGKVQVDAPSPVQW